VSELVWQHAFTEGKTHDENRALAVMATVLAGQPGHSLDTSTLNNLARTRDPSLPNLKGKLGRLLDACPAFLCELRQPGNRRVWLDVEALTPAASTSPSFGQSFGLQSSGLMPSSPPPAAPAAPVASASPTAAAGCRVVGPIADPSGADANAFMTAAASPDCKVAAVDTEFMPASDGGRQLCLIQVGADPEGHRGGKVGRCKRAHEGGGNERKRVGYSKGWIYRRAYAIRARHM
jgi:hypothetical protein